MALEPKIESSWKDALKEEFQAGYFKDLKQFLVEEHKKQTVYPPGKLIFNAFNLTPLNNVKVVIIGQDPYHGAGQAHGLCFSVPQGVKQPPSLVNIIKEMVQDVGISPPQHGNLEAWAKQGVLLINATLTVRANQAGSHQGKGWETFTNKVIKTVSDKKDGVVFLLWGKFAQAKEQLINGNKHCILKAAHPSPLSAYNGFLGCKHFSTTNNYLVKQAKEPINWQI